MRLVMKKISLGSYNKIEGVSISEFNGQWSMVVDFVENIEIEWSKKVRAFLLRRFLEAHRLQLHRTASVRHKCTLMKYSKMRRKYLRVPLSF